MRQAHGLKSLELLNKKWYLNISLLATILQKCMKIYFKKEKKRVYWPIYTKKLENDGIDKGEKKFGFHEICWPISQISAISDSLI